VPLTKTRRKEIEVDNRVRIAVALGCLALVGSLHAQTITELSIRPASSWPFGIVAGPAGNLWFTEGNANQIGRITTAGIITELFLALLGAGLVVLATGPGECSAVPQLRPAAQELGFQNLVAGGKWIPLSFCLQVGRKWSDLAAT
jgi:hypothetical protein